MSSRIAVFSLLWVVSGFVLVSAAQEKKDNSAAVLARRQEQILQDYRRFEAALLRMAELTESDSPSRASVLKEAALLSRRELITPQFEELIQLISRDNLTGALKKQSNVKLNLENLLELLNRVDQSEGELRRLRELIEGVEDLTEHQKNLRQQTSRSANLADDATRQNQLAGRAGDLASKASKQSDGASTPEASSKPDPASGGSSGAQAQSGQGPQSTPAGSSSSEQNPTGQKIRSAQRSMEDAASEMTRQDRGEAVKKQDDAIRKLEQIQKILEDELEQRRVEEQLQKLERLEATIRRMLDKERAIFDGTQRLGSIERSQLGRAEQILAGQLSRKQDEVSQDADKMLTLIREEGSAVALPEVIAQAQMDMQQVSQRLTQFDAGAMTLSLESQIIESLEEMIVALQREKQSRDEGAASQQQQQSTTSSSQPSPLIEKIAELKLLRSLQSRVNRRTQQFIGLTESEREQSSESIRQLAVRQLRIQEITRELARPEGQ